MSPTAPDMAELANVIGMAWALLEPYDWDRIATDLERAHTLGPILEPTAYRQTLATGTLTRNQRVVGIARRFADDMAALRDEVLNT